MDLPHNVTGVVLAVDDTPGNLRVLVEALSSAGHEVLVATDGRAALDTVRYARPDLILLDVMMPELDGFETCAALKDNPDTRHIPVVILTSSRAESDRLTSQGLGVSAYMVKPVDFHQLIDAVKSAGAFWAVVNEPPPGCVRSIASSGTGCANVPEQNL